VLDRVGDVEPAPIDAEFVERTIEQRTRRTHERQAAEIFGVAGLFPDHDDARVVRARAEDRLCRRFPQVAALAARCRVTQCLQAVVDRHRRTAIGHGPFARSRGTRGGRLFAAGHAPSSPGVVDAG